METSIFLAKLFGPYCLIVAAGVLLNKNFYQKMMENLIANSAMIYLGGVIALLFGLLTVLAHNVWAADWRVLITILGWIALIKGIWIIVFPASMVKVTDYHLKNPSILVMRLTIVVTFGLILTIFGYFM